MITKEINAIKMLFEAQLKGNCQKIVRHLVNHSVSEESIILLSDDLYLSKIEIQTVNPKNRVDIRIVPLEFCYVLFYPSEKIESLIDRVISRYISFFEANYGVKIDTHKQQNIIDNLLEF